MTLYDILDRIADAVIPAYAALFALSIAYRFARGNLRLCLAHLSECMAGMAVVFGFYGIDLALGLWPAVALDYSTHTAFSLCLVMMLDFYGLRTRIALYVSLLLYFWLMVYQNYHSVLDIATTAAVVLPSIVLARRLAGAACARLSILTA